MTTAARMEQWWGSIGEGTGYFAHLVRFLLYLALLFLAWQIASMVFTWQAQAVLAVATILVGFLIHRISRSEGVTLALMMASLLSTARYAYWRYTTVYEAVTKHHQTVGWLNITFMLLLLSAESYAFFILLLGYIQTVRPLHRPPIAMPQNTNDWPDIDVLIPTYNEPLEIVRPTAFAARNMDYPEDKLHVFILDDGRREEFRKFAEEAGIGYVTRTDNKHAKAGNINAALKNMSAPYTAIFDCDHIPTRSFLQVTMGWFLKDRKLGMMQTPHFFYSPDPFERNLNQFMQIPNEGELFYGVIQDGNDLWNATFFCGSCAVLRRTAIDEIGGIAVETVTEDVHTSLRMQSRGWSTAYINLPQAAGLATESLSGHVGQRVRWARGMIQILRTDNPVFAKGLRWPQRLCYLNAMIHFLYAGPRLVFLTSPLIFMLLGHINIPGFWIAILVFAAPHLFLSNLANFRVQGRYRYSFWNEVYETVLAPYILGPTLLALVNPRLGKFNVTAKGGMVKHSYFDSKIARPYVFLILLNVLALAIAPIRFIWWNPHQPGTLIMNIVWILFNLVILGTANAVAYESKQTREGVRVDIKKPAFIQLRDGRRIEGESVDLSLGGARLTLKQAVDLPNGTPIRAIFPQRDGTEAIFAAHVNNVQGYDLSLGYEPQSEEEQELLTLVIYSDADSWLSRIQHRQYDRPMHSLGRLVTLSVRGVWWALIDWLPFRSAAAAAILFAMLLAGAPALHGQVRPGSAGKAPVSFNAAQSAPAAPGGFHTTFQLKDVGVAGPILFRGVDAAQNVPFQLSNTAVAQNAVMHLHYGFSPSLISSLSHLNVFLNDTLVATLPAPLNQGQMEKEIDADIPLPANLLVHENVLRLQFIGHYTMQCEDPSNSSLWGRVENTSSVEITGARIAVPNDLGILPFPFYDGSVGSEAGVIPVMFASAPGAQALDAAGAVASWFGVQIKSKPLRFPVQVGGGFPTGNLVLFVENPQSVPPEIYLPHGEDEDKFQIYGPTLAMRTNPSDPYGEILIVAGTNPAELLTAAQALASGGAVLQGSKASLTNVQLPAPRQADDAPLWMTTDHIVPLWDYPTTSELQSDGSAPVAVYVHTAPDLYYGDRQTLRVHLDYRYNPMPLANESTLRVDANGAMVTQLPMPHEDAPKRQLSADLDVPIENMRPFSNTFLHNFYFQIAKKGHCEDTAPINLQGALLRSSYLDIKGLYHWAEMPNIELFANAGFPFTRYADLAQTRIILPKNPSPEETGLYLSLMGYFGEQTGYPALRVQVADSSALGQDFDYLVLGTVTDQPAFDSLKNQLYVAQQNGGYTVRNTGQLFEAVKHAWWNIAELRPRWWRKMGAGESGGLVSSLGTQPDAVIQGIESPWNHSRSVVTISLRDGSLAQPFADAFWRVSGSSAISESISVLHGTQFTSYRVGENFYHVGHLPWWEQLRYWLRQFPWSIVPLTFILGIFLIPWIKMRLDKRAHDRLNPDKA